MSDSLLCLSVISLEFWHYYRFYPHQIKSFDSKTTLLLNQVIEYISISLTVFLFFYEIHRVSKNPRKCSNTTCILTNLPRQLLIFPFLLILVEDAFQRKEEMTRKYVIKWNFWETFKCHTYAFISCLTNFHFRGEVRFCDSFKFLFSHRCADLIFSYRKKQNLEFGLNNWKLFCRIEWGHK
jgi:hypothetical protein